MPHPSNAFAPAFFLLAGPSPVVAAILKGLATTHSHIVPGLHPRLYACNDFRMYREVGFLMNVCLLINVYFFLRSWGLSTSAWVSLGPSVPYFFCNLKVDLPICRVFAESSVLEMYASFNSPTGYGPFS